jgi:hypothetical protein
VKELAPGLHRWAARHPEWHPGAFGAEVASFALSTPDGDLLLLDPLAEDEAVVTALDALAGAARKTYIFITIGYHARSAEALAARYDATIHGPATVRPRLTKDDNFIALAPGDEPGPAGVRAFAIGRPRRSETPLHFPSHDAVAFGDALVTTPDGELRMWIQDEPTPKRVAFYRERFAPTLQPLADLRPRRILTTHGAPILDDGAAALETALATPPWFHHG